MHDFLCNCLKIVVTLRYPQNDAGNSASDTPADLSIAVGFSGYNMHSNNEIGHIYTVFA